MDQGQRSGDRVLVRFGTVTGWAAHDYLLPIIAPAPPAPVPTPTPTGADANFVGTWLLTAKVGPCQTCTLAITTAGTSLSLVSSEGWVANLTRGADPTRATGRGFWHAGTGAGTGFTMEVTTAGLTMQVRMVPESGPPVTRAYQRPAGG